MRKNQLYYIIFSVLAVSASYFFTTNEDSSQYTVLKVIDGDTVRLDDSSETTLRFIGIDSPEIFTPDSPGEPFSSEARKLNEELVEGKNVILEFDKEKYDHYGRMLAYVYADGVFVNEQLVRNGLATSLRVKPNTKHYGQILKAEQEAKRNRKGIWSDKRNYFYPKENRQFFIKPHQAADNIGQRVITRGKITDVRKSEKVLVLRMDQDLDVVMFTGGLNNFKFFGIDPERDYVGFPVEVIGRVKKYKGRPQIVVNHPITLKKLL